MSESPGTIHCPLCNGVKFAQSTIWLAATNPFILMRCHNCTHILWFQPTNIDRPAVITDEEDTLKWRLVHLYPPGTPLPPGFDPSKA